MPLFSAPNSTAATSSPGGLPSAADSLSALKQIAAKAAEARLGVGHFIEIGETLNLFVREYAGMRV